MTKENLHENYISEAIKGFDYSSFQTEVSWQSPSNIALVKYWGKHGNQLPNNPSISFTLSQSRTETKVNVTAKGNITNSFSFLFEGKEAPEFGKKVQQYLHSLSCYFPFVHELAFAIESRNTFPHSSGIASSASSMSALAACLLDIENQMFGKESGNINLKKASYIARLGSGSAARSVFPYASEWGKTNALHESCNEFALPLANSLHPVYQNYQDSILLIHSGVKAVSSRAGHVLMETNPFADARYQQANHNTSELLNVLKTGDLDAFIRITEAEAMQLHALMMVSEPSFILIQPNTLAAIAAIHDYRKQTGIPLCFTLDAGPNIHLLYPESYRKDVLHFIQHELLLFCNQQQWIDDRLGLGTSKIVTF